MRRGKTATNVGGDTAPTSTALAAASARGGSRARSRTRTPGANRAGERTFAPRAKPASRATKSVPSRTSTASAAVPKKAATARKPAAAKKAAVPKALPPEELLDRAMRAETARARGLWARRGLASRRLLDRTIHAMLLRQLYLSHYELRSFAKARDVAAQWLELGVLTDVAHQDIARALQALGDIDGAAGHLRLAGRASPASRRAFHSWTLGSLYFLAGRFNDAENAMERAVRWGTKAKPLYQGHLAVVQCAAGKRVRGLGALLDRLAEIPAGTGYGRLVLGMMAFYDERFAEARRYLGAFVDKTTRGRLALAIALDGELNLARSTLAKLPPA